MNESEHYRPASMPTGWVVVPGPTLIHVGAFYTLNGSPRQVRVTSIEGNGYVYYRTPHFGTNWDGPILSDVMELGEFRNWVYREITPHG